ncbi:hypothetical protein LAZ67_15001294 [Cordylochernes scorpioides]|uniref:Uncharacterized protein n=1 Tax=Cordylochernes scorpioides TaxID=51811 RepID=A0ABY6L8X2_9ARAC|nr:hypothetical protein LAZ67_15001294 [Cordylochernes scorpioides]
MNKELLRGIWLVNKACRFAPEIIGRDPDKEDKESETDLKEQKSEDYYLPDKDEVLQALIKSLHDDFKVDPTKKETPSETKSKSNDSENKDNNLNLSLQDKFKVYTDENFEVVLSHEEQEYCIAQKYSEGEEPEYTIYPPKKTAKHFENERGTTGVFDLEDFVSILRQEKVLDIAVIQIPEEKDYGTYMVLGTGLSPRHLNGTMELINKLNFVKAMDRNASGFAYLKQKFSSISKAKIKEGIFVGPQIRELQQNGNFQNSLNEVEAAAWNSFRNVCKTFLGSAKVENY